MLVKAGIPADFYIVGPKNENLVLTTTFYYKKLKCVINISGDNTSWTENTAVEERMVVHTNKIDVLLEESIEGNYIKNLVESGEYRELVSVITKVSNRCMEAVRNFGMVPHIHEILEDYPRAECILFFWSVQVSYDGINWNQIILKPRNYEQLHNYFSYKQPPSGRLDVHKWPEIEKALIENLTPPPEREFLTNSIESLRIKNYRLALIEAIIGLEITLTRYLTKYLSKEKGLSKTRIKDLVSPDLDLTARVSVLLNLIVDPLFLQEIDLEKILAAISWRNSVIHKTGKIPFGVTEKALSEGIDEVLKLITLLGYLYEKI